MELSAIILAAGQGSRAGGYKPLWSLGEELVIDRVIRSARAVCQQVIVVGGAYFKELSTHVLGHHREVVLLNNEDWRVGEMFSSVRLGLHRVRAPVFVHPADIPGPDGEIYRALKNALQKNISDVIRPVYHGRGGHPILLGESARQAALEARADSNLRDVLKGMKRCDVEVDTESVLRDFDTQDDFSRLLELLRKG